MKNQPTSKSPKTPNCPSWANLEEVNNVVGKKKALLVRLKPLTAEFEQNQRKSISSVHHIRLWKMLNDFEADKFFKMIDHRVCL